MEIKEINKIIQSDDKDEKAKSVKCICINYGDFLADCEGFVQKRYHDFKCNPKHQFEKKADTILENAIHEKNFMPDLFLIRLNRKQSACNSQIDFVFELLDKSFLETDPIRKSEISEENLINENLDFNITSEDEVNLDKPTLYNNLANPIVLSYINHNIKTDYTITDTSTPMTYDGSLLKRCNILLNNIACSFSFDVYVTNNLSQEFKCTIYIDIPLDLDNQSIYNGNITLKKDTNFNFYRYR